MNEAALRLHLAFEMFEAGVALMRQNLRRRHPDLDEAAIDRLVGAWLQDRPGAPYGDTAGRPCEFPRRRP
jgi:hypothetical protein